MGEFVDLSLFTSPGKINAHDGDTHNHAALEHYPEVPGNSAGRWR